MQIIVVETLERSVTLRNIKRYSSGKRGVRDPSLQFAITCETYLYTGRVPHTAAFETRIWVTLSELAQTPLFPLQYVDFPMETVKGYERWYAQSDLCAGSSQVFVRV